MRTIQIKDKVFHLCLSEKAIIDEVKRVAADINRDYEGKQPLFLCILNGSFMFASDLLKEITIPCQVSFVKFASYQGTASTGVIREVMGLNESIKGRDVIVVEDIIDTGFTMQRSLEILGTHEPASLKICSLLCKPSKLKVDLGDSLRYVALNIPDDFIVGYGLDYDGYGRNYRDIYCIIDK
ncbi:MAG: hypoxanthine phosphoribosyltransferase [Bacteroidaceae bacterium]|nr:hypoxanthine phosphoribosyltransferase [Bacteroidaceae bacterium]